MGVTQPVRLAAIGGGGWLGGALLRAALDRQVITAENTVITSRRATSVGFEAYRGLRLTADNAAAAAEADIVLLAVRPQDLQTMSLDLRGKLVLSVMAMVPLDTLHARFGAIRMVRAMPNAAAERSLSYTPLLGTGDLSAEDRAFVERFFAASGLAEWVSTERQLDYLTGLTGSGPAFFAALAAAMEKDAILHGLPEAMAGRAIMQLLKGAAGELSGSRTPRELVDIFLGYEGTTAAGLAAMAENGLAGMVRAMLEKAAEKAATSI